MSDSREGVAAEPYGPEEWPELTPEQEAERRLDAEIEVLLGRRRRELTMVELEVFQLAMRHQCPPPPRGCSARPGRECVSLADGGPLVRQLFHMARGRNAGVEWEPTTDAEIRSAPRARGSLARQSQQAQADWERVQMERDRERSAAASDQGWR